MADDIFPIERIIGIDFGTTKCVAAVMQEGKPVVIPSQEGNSITPSLVSFSKAHEIIVGTKARSQAVLNPRNTIVSIKRYLGRNYSDPVIQGLLSSVPCKVKQAAEDEIQIICDQREYTPCLISAMILRQIKANADAFLGGNIFKAVIAVPACYNDTQRHAIIDGGRRRQPLSAPPSSAPLFQRGVGCNHNRLHGIGFPRTTGHRLPWPLRKHPSASASACISLAAASIELPLRSSYVRRRMEP